MTVLYIGVVLVVSIWLIPIVPFGYAPVIPLVVLWVTWEVHHWIIRRQILKQARQNDLDDELKNLLDGRGRTR